MATGDTLVQLKAQESRKRLINLEIDEIAAIVTRLLDILSSVATIDRADLRRQIGKLRSTYVDALLDITFSNELLLCFTLARTSSVDLNSLARVRNSLFAEEPIGTYPKAIVQSATMFCLSTESRIISAMEFVSRDDVEAMMARMKIAFDTARDRAADETMSDAYEQLTYLSGALTNHLASTARPLPRMVNFTLRTPLPLPVVAQRFYYDPGRWEEVLTENAIVHPAFPPMQLRGLAR